MLKNLYEYVATILVIVAAYFAVVSLAYAIFGGYYGPLEVAMLRLEIQM